MEKSHTAHRGKRNINHVERACKKRPIWPRQKRLWLKLDSLRPLKNWPAKKWRCCMRTFLSLWTFFLFSVPEKEEEKKILRLLLQQPHSGHKLSTLKCYVTDLHCQETCFKIRFYIIASRLPSNNFFFRKFSHEQMRNQFVGKQNFVMAFLNTLRATEKYSYVIS